MADPTRTFTRPDGEGGTAAAAAGAAAFAYNRNYNILFMPYVDTTVGDAARDGEADKSNGSYPSKEDLEGLFRRINDGDTETEAEAKATGNSSI